MDQKVSFSFDDLLQMDVVEHDITLTCVSNEVGGNLVGAARWLGVPLRDVLDRAGIANTRADQILSTAVDGFTISTPLQVALDGRNSMVAFGMNGEPLPREHGFPVRLVTPGLYGYVGSTKWLEKLTLTTYDAREAYWTKRKWAIDAPIKLSSRVDTPRPLSTIDAGQQRHRRCRLGAARRGRQGGGPPRRWRVAGGQARPERRVEYWRQWYLPWKAPSGSHQIAVRATNREGRDPDHRPGDPVPRRLHRDPGSRRHRRLNFLPSRPIRSGSSTESP